MYEPAMKGLMGQTAIAALISDRAYPLELPQVPLYPCVVFTVVSAPTTHTHSGRRRLEPIRVQFEAFGETYDDAVAVKDAIRTTLDLFRGDVNGVRVSRVFINMEDDGTDSAAQRVGASRRIRRKMIDATIWCREP